MFGRHHAKGRKDLGQCAYPNANKLHLLKGATIRLAALSSLRFTVTLSFSFSLGLVVILVSVLVVVSVAVIVVSVIVFTFPLPILLTFRSLIELVVLFAILRNNSAVVPNAIPVKLTPTKVLCPSSGKPILALRVLVVTIERIQSTRCTYKCQRIVLLQESQQGNRAACRGDCSPFVLSLASSLCLSLRRCCQRDENRTCDECKSRKSKNVCCHMATYR
jgi:hypothetical protein